MFNSGLQWESVRLSGFLLLGGREDLGEGREEPPQKISQIGGDRVEGNGVPSVLWTAAELRFPKLCLAGRDQHIRPANCKICTDPKLNCG